MEMFFKILAVVLAGVAAFFLWQGNSEGAFVAAVLGAVSFFLSIRFQVKERMKQRELAMETNHGQLVESTVNEEDLITEEDREANKNQL
jgi:hypothetical protein